MALHPIFDNTSTQKDSSCNKRYFFSSEDGKRVISVIGSRHIRWCLSSSNSYKSLVLESLPEKCTGVINTVSGNYLCFYNENEINVIEVPWGYPDDISSMRSKFHVYNHSFTGQRKIKQILFHPKAYRESCIVILFDDDTITMVNYNRKPENGGIIELNGHDLSLGLESRVTRIETMQFSQDGISLLLLSTAEGGDIHAVYPCLPASMQAERKEFNTLFQKSMLLYKNINEHTTSEVKRNLVKTLKFAEYLKKEAEKNENLNIPIEIEQQYQFVKAQGPFSISPYPEELYEYNAVDMKGLPIGNNQSLLLVSFSNGSILVLFQDLELTMSWDVANFTNNNSLSMIEHIKVDSMNVSQLQVLPGDVGKFICDTNKGLILIDTSNWSSAFSSIIVNSDMNKLLSLNIASKIETINIPPSANSCIRWMDKNHTKQYFVDQAMVYTLDTDKKPNNIDQNDSTKNSKFPNDKESNRYELSFLKPLSEIKAAESAYQKSIREISTFDIPYKLRNENLNNDTNENQLDILTKVAEKYTMTIGLGQNVAFNYNARIVEDITHLQKQICVINSLRERCKDIDDRRAVQENRFQDVKNRNQKLFNRLEALGTNVSKASENLKHSDLDITEAENEWFKEIKKYVLSFNQYVKQTQSTQEELNYIKNQLSSITTSSNVSAVDKANQEEWKQLQDILHADMKLISNCSKEMNSITTGINKLNV
ncbi:hypothetical protein RNJ44_04637 [Nakaseomyces bracarensis]|uniref:Uncharacterized protein n=1 Tax=Nakaseomyces bracarensis TaxID=273131 RepID=A0ABR4NVG0_9SACH